MELVIVASARLLARVMQTMASINNVLLYACLLYRRHNQPIPARVVQELAVPKGRATNVSAGSL